jgi:hypothetical protein
VSETRIAPASADTMTFGQVVRIAAALAAAGAGILHLDAAGDHTEHAHVAAFFVAVAVAQLAWASSIARRTCSTRTLVLGLGLHAAVFGVWMVSRTVGLPDLIPDVGGVEELGLKDAAASGLELVAVAAGAFALVMPAAAVAATMPAALAERVLRGMAVATLAITVPGVLVAHEHGAHAHGEDAAHGHAAEAALEVHAHDGDAAHEDTSEHTHDGEVAVDEQHVHSEVIEGHPAHTTTAAVTTGGHDHATGSPAAPADAHGDHAAHTDGTTDHAGHEPAAAALGPDFPDPLAGPGNVTSVRIGPFALLPQIPLLNMPHLSPAIPRILPGELNILPLLGVPPPCQDCYVLGLQPDLVYADGTPANLDTGPMLHHAVWIDPTREDPVCGRGSLIGSLGHRVFASGNERTGFALPQGFGMPVDGRGTWSGAVELMNMSEQLRLVYIQLTTRWVPRSTPDVDPVTSVWLDIDSCGDSSVDIPAGVTDIPWDWQSNLTGRIVSAGGHVHDGGEWLGLTNETTGEHVCTSVAGYGTNPAYQGAIESMSGCLWDRLGTVREGDRLRLNAHYNTTTPQLGVMGIMVMMVHETTDLTAGSQSPYPSVPPPDGAPAAGHQH